MATSRQTLEIVLDVKNSQMAARTLDDVSRGAKGAGRSAEGATRGFARLTGGLGRFAFRAFSAYLGIRTLTRGVTSAARATIGFDRAMRNVNSIAGLSEKQLGRVQRAVLGMAGRTAQAPKVLAEGLYELVSSGFNARDSLTILRASANAATAGLTDTATATKAVAAVLNAYHLPAKAAAKVSDTLFRTVDRGVISFEDLSSSIGDVLPFASALGVPLNELGAAISTLTKQGIGPAETMTRLRGVMQTFIKPGKDMAAAIARTGYESGEALVKALGLQGAIEAVTGTTDGSKASIAKLFPNVRALSAVLALTGRNARSAHADLKTFADVTGATNKALAEQSKSIAFQWTRIKTIFSAAAIYAGTKALPLVSKALGRVSDMAGKVDVDQLFEKLGGVLSRIDLASVTGPVLEFGEIALPVIRDALTELAPVALRVGRDSLGMLRGGFADVLKVAGPFVKTVLPPTVSLIKKLAPAIAPAVAAFVGYRKTVAGVRAGMKAYQMVHGKWERGMKTGRKALDLARTGLGKAKTGVAALRSAFSSSNIAIARFAAKAALLKAKSIALAAAQKIATAAQWLWNASLFGCPLLLIVAAVAALVVGIVIAYKKVGWFRDLVDKAFDTILGTIKAVWRWAKSNWPLLLSILTGPFRAAILFVGRHFGEIKAKIVQVFSDAKAWIRARVVDDIAGFFQQLPGKIGSALAGVWDKLTGPFKSAIGWIERRIQGLVDAYYKLPFTGRNPRDVARDNRAANQAYAGMPRGTRPRAEWFFRDASGAPTVRIPGRALGGVTRPWEKMTLVGEHGPELASFPAGTRITPSEDLGMFTPNRVKPQPPAHELGITRDELVRLIREGIRIYNKIDLDGREVYAGVGGEMQDDRARRGRG